MRRAVSSSTWVIIRLYFAIFASRSCSRWVSSSVIGYCHAHCPARYQRPAKRSIIFAVALLCAPSLYPEACIASHYGVGDGYGGRRTASGEVTNPRAMTAAQKTRAFGAHVMVTILGTGRSITVRINDRRPFIRGRCIDLSYGSPRALGMGGTAGVSVE